jgi:uncharacterized protein (TIRG00374 family)
MALKQRYSAALATSIVVAFFSYFFAALWSGYDSTLTAIKSVDFSLWLIILSLSLSNYLLRFLRWEAYLEVLSGFEISRFRHLLIYLAGFALTTTPGKAGETLRSFYLKTYDLSFSNSLCALFVERLIDLIAILLMALMALTYFDDQEIRLIAILSFASVIILLPLIHNQSLWLMIRSLGARLPERLSVIFTHFIAMRSSSSKLLRSRLLYSGLALGLLAWLLEGIGFYILLEALNVECTLILAIGIYAMAVLVGAVSFSAGGLGGTEAAMVFMLISIGADKPTAVAATLICRIATLWFAVLIGAASMALLARDGILPSFKAKTKS